MVVIIVISIQIIISLITDYRLLITAHWLTYTEQLTAGSWLRSFGAGKEDL
jgi:hypothetical protein